MLRQVHFDKRAPGWEEKIVPGKKVTMFMSVAWRWGIIYVRAGKKYNLFRGYTSG